MIIAIEGPDGVGKTTLVNRLRRLFRYAHFIQFKNVPAVFYQHIIAIEPLVFTLFEQMYDSRLIYICDRFFSVSSRVYAKLHKRCYELPDAWVMPDLHVIRLECKVDTLRRRRPSEGRLDQLNSLYREVCAKLACSTYHVINSDESIHNSVSQVATLIRELIKDVDGEGHSESPRMERTSREGVGVGERRKRLSPIAIASFSTPTG